MYITIPYNYCRIRTVVLNRFPKHNANNICIHIIIMNKYYPYHFIYPTNAYCVVCVYKIISYVEQPRPIKMSGLRAALYRGGQINVIIFLGNASLIRRSWYTTKNCRTKKPRLTSCYTYVISYY